MDTQHDIHSRLVDTERRRLLKELARLEANAADRGCAIDQMAIAMTRSCLAAAGRSETSRS